MGKEKSRLPHIPLEDGWNAKLASNSQLFFDSLTTPDQYHLTDPLNLLSLVQQWSFVESRKRRLDPIPP